MWSEGFTSKFCGIEIAWALMQEDSRGLPVPNSKCLFHAKTHTSVLSWAKEMYSWMTMAFTVKTWFLKSKTITIVIATQSVLPTLPFKLRRLTKWNGKHCLAFKTCSFLVNKHFSTAQMKRKVFQKCYLSFKLLIPISEYVGISMLFQLYFGGTTWYGMGKYWEWSLDGHHWAVLQEGV